MAYWLMKTEPDAFSIDDLAKRGREPWDGVRNYQARNFIRQMNPGDGVLFYHSSCPVPGVAGIAKIATEAYPDPSQFKPKSKYYDAASRPEDPRWWLVDVVHVRTFDRVVTLDELKALPVMEGSHLTQRGSRLSVLPVTPAQWKAVLAQEKKQ
jgi:predicted RNA-binding protein with PUA-like domain